jgi:sugar-phosphatase
VGWPRHRRCICWKKRTLFGLRDNFDALASAEKLPYSKPHPQVYLDCAAKLGVDPLACVALEDSVNGMIASKAARMRSMSCQPKRTVMIHAMRWPM